MNALQTNPVQRRPLQTAVGLAVFTAPAHLLIFPPRAAGLGLPQGGVPDRPRPEGDLFLLMVAPLVQTVVFGFAVDFDVDRVPTVVVDADHTAGSREHARRLLADGTLSPAGAAAGMAEAERAIDRGDAAAALFLPPGLSADLLAGRPAEVQVVLDGTDPNRATVAAGTVSRYFGEVGEAMARDRLAARGVPAPARVQLAPRLAYNPELRSPPFMVPGRGDWPWCLIALVVSMLLATGCATSGAGARAPRPGDGLREYQRLVLDLRQDVTQTGQALEALAAATQRNSGAAYARFDESLQRLEVVSIKARARVEAMERRGEAYLEEWAEEISNTSNDRRVAEARFAELHRHFETILKDAGQVRKEFRPFLEELRRLRTTLGPKPTFEAMWPSYAWARAMTATRPACPHRDDSKRPSHAPNCIRWSCCCRSSAAASSPHNSS